MDARFKFRAWHKPTKKLFPVHCFTNEHVYENTLDGVGTPTNPASTDDCVLEQCTWLVDLRGVPIYEGDIVRVWSQPDKKYFFAEIKFGQFGGYDKNLGFYTKWYGKYACKTKYDSGFREDICFWIGQGLEVVGNIHETPELLEVKK